MSDNGKAIFITGGGSGIGRAVAQLFAGRGWQVGLGDINETGLAETAALLPGGMVRTYRMDVRQRADWERALADFVAHAGRLDVMMNNAGIALGGPFAAATPEDLDRVVGINFTAVLTGAHVAHRYLNATPGSCLLNTASASAIYGTPGLAAYSATKFGVRGLTEALDIEWQGDGIKVRSIMPGFIDTPLLSVPVAGSNRTARDSVNDAGLEWVPVETVAQAAWDAVHGKAVHSPIGKTARGLNFAARWMPGRLRNRMGGLVK